jgi:hypothetical protein
MLFLMNNLKVVYAMYLIYEMFSHIAVLRQCLSWQWRERHCGNVLLGSGARHDILSAARPSLCMASWLSDLEQQ